MGLIDNNYLYNLITDLRQYEVTDDQKDIGEETEGGIKHEDTCG